MCKHIAARLDANPRIPAVSIPGNLHKVDLSRPSLLTRVVRGRTVAVLVVGMACIVAYVTTLPSLTSPLLVLRDGWSGPILPVHFEMLRISRPQDNRDTVHPPDKLLTGITSIHALTSLIPADGDTKGTGVFGHVPNTSCGPDIVFGATSASAICASSSWEFIGTTGQLSILFPRPSRLNTVTVQVQHEAALSKCAPRDVVLWGLVSRQRDLATLRLLHHSVDRAFALLPGAVAFPTHESHQVLVPLAVFRFNTHSENLTQTFAVGPLWDADHKRAGLKEEDGIMGFGVAILQILTNWGSPSTCIDRLYFHGGDL